MLTKAFTVALTIFVIEFVSVPSLAETSLIKDIASFKDFVSKHPEIRRIEDILPHFDRSVFARHEVVYHSRSLQRASTTNPRVIFFNKDASFAFSINGDPNLLGYDSIEMYQAHDFPAADFEFFSHSFPGDVDKINEERLKEGKDPYVPTKRDCKTCHRQDLRPNWDDYSVRPGVVSNEFDLSRLKLNLDHPRYKYLKLGRRASFGPLAAQHNYKRIMRKMFANDNFERFKFALLGSMGGCEDIETFIPFDSKNYEMKNYSAMVQDTKARLEKHMAEKLERRKKDIEAGIIDPSTSKLELRYSEFSSVPGVAALRFVTQWMGLEMEDWSMTLPRGTLAMREQGNPFVPAYGYYELEPNTPSATAWYNKDVPYPASQKDFFSQLSKRANATDVAFFKEVPEPFKSFKEEQQPHRNKTFAGYVDCGSLKKASLKALSGWAPSKPDMTAPATSVTH